MQLQHAVLLVGRAVLRLWFVVTAIRSHVASRWVSVVIRLLIAALQFLPAAKVEVIAALVGEAVAIQGGTVASPVGAVHFGPRAAATLLSASNHSSQVK